MMDNRTYYITDIPHYDPQMGYEIIKAATIRRQELFVC